MRHAGEAAMVTRVMRLGLAGGVLCAVLAATSPAAAQDLFQQLFGGLARVFSAPRPAPLPDAMQSLASAPDEVVTPRPNNGPAHAFCVRTCDGHFFPVEAHGRLTAAASCQSACPAADTRLYSGSNIDYAQARDGSRYADLPTAFLYRKKLVPGCTCNGRTAFGIAPSPAADDPTLRPGDIVATRDGLMAVTREGEFTPAATYAGLPAAERAKLAGMKIRPQYGVPLNEVTAATRTPLDNKAASLTR
jgi:hypothetical protein